MILANRLFIFTNFDGTTFNTFEPAPSGIGVHEAYELAIKKLYGEKGLDAYKKLGGLQNREPGQLYDLLMRELGINVTPPDERDKEVKGLVDAKLSYMLDDISPNWPKPYPGVVDFFKAIEEGKLPVVFGVASSGHREFIEKVYRVNGLKPPGVMITSDDINGLVEPRRPLYRPHTYQIAGLHYRMLGLPEGEDRAGRFLDRRDGVKDHAVFIGDHPAIDGGVAGRARIPFLFVPFRYPDFVPDKDEGQILIPDFNSLRERLEDHKEDIERGMSASEVFFGIPDAELFPDVVESERPFNVWLRAMREGAAETSEWTGFPITPITRGSKEIA